MSSWTSGNQRGGAFRKRSPLVQRCNYLMEYENRSAAFELWRGTHSLLIKSTCGYSAFDVYGCGLIELRDACPGSEDRRRRENRGEESKVIESGRMGKMADEKLDGGKMKFCDCGKSTRGRKLKERVENRGEEI